MTALCAACRPKWLAWLDYRLTPPIRIHAIGEDNTRAQRDRRNARFEEWRNTILFQQQLIADACASSHAPARQTPDIPTIAEQMHLFDLTSGCAA